MLLEDDDDGDGGGNDDDRGVQLPTSWKAGSRSLLLDAQKTEWPVGEVSTPTGALHRDDYSSYSGLRSYPGPPCITSVISGQGYAGRMEFPTSWP